MKCSVLALALAVALAATPSLARTLTDTDGTPIPGVNDRSNATNAPGYCQVTVPTTSTTLPAMLSTAATAVQGGTCSAPSWATWAYFRPETAGVGVVRCAADGTTLSTTLGWPLDGAVGFPMPGGVKGGAPFSTLKCMSATGASVLMDIWWMG
jgi:hypothetical protein